MKDIRKYLIPVFAMITSGCNGIFSDIYDTPAESMEIYDDFSEIPTADNRYRLKIDTSDFGEWTYVSLKNKRMEKYAIPLACEGEWDGMSGISYNLIRNGQAPEFIECIPADRQPEPADWDIALHRFDVRTNEGAVAATGLRNLNEIAGEEDARGLTFYPDTWSTSGVMVDIKEMLAYKIGYQNISYNAVLSGWVTMHINAGPPTYTASGLVYILKMKDGSLAALQLIDYMNDQGDKGHLVIDIIYPLR